MDPADSAPRPAACACHTPMTPGSQAISDLIEALRLLGHPLRFNLLTQLARGPVAVGELAARTGQSLSIISQQLALLRKAGLVQGRREVKQVFYSLAGPRVAEVAQALAEMALAGGAQGLSAET
ncbi:ArsR/SmtB family transcription factor [Novosphingobium humi]|uniref:Metalloregulator ArsR/SmtB family transcription factor n=2 Tax=Novosphingobium humi TaxID=2282397 RepID=A0ABY7U2U7_9SPHN|nr:metalloregulator ArsR/SmtB family transcription factor [Novosphingobium humi]WCT78910.1 metalloregulator ArsR/SmtB family transcription factor [Novosphingobium humi]